MTSTHLVNNSRARRVRRSVYDSYIPPSQPADDPVDVAPDTAPRRQWRVLADLVTTTSDGAWIDLTTFRVDWDRSPTAAEVATPRDCTSADPRGEIDAATQAPPAVTAIVDEPATGGIEAADPAALLSALAQQVASGSALPEVRAEALEWLRDLGGSARG